jgi:hypothetical protein
MVSCAAYLAFLALPAAAPSPEAPVTFAPADIAFFEAKVRPLLAEHCYSCHSVKAKRPKGGLLLDTRGTALRGGDSGPALVPGQPNKSLLVMAVRYRDEGLQMPPKGKLGERDIALLEEWVRRGAPFPPDKTTKITKEGPSLEEGRKFWSFRPPAPRPLPVLKNAAWPRRDIDAFILAELEKRGLEPGPAVTRRDLIRRATFDLVGLPPTPAQVQDFIHDKRPDAYARMVDRLLSSPQYGERWGRFWLDLARYCDIAEPWAECKGQPYLYRDWVVQAFNDDLPYNHFVMKQLAADLMPGGKPGDRAALGFLGLSPSYWKELKLDPVVIQTVVAEEWEERIHALTSTFLGLTVACARCHDHKFDPITTADYYALAGVLASTRLADRDLLPDDQAKDVRQARQRVKELEAKIKGLEEKKPLSAAAQKSITAWKTDIAAIKKTVPLLDAPLAPGVMEASLLVLPDGPHRTRLEYKPGMAQNVAMQVRGNPGNRGPVVPRRFLAILSPDAKPFASGSGRLELATALVTDGAPLAARVIVNRTWKHHFGAGLVETPSDFGSQGERPSHPELLDDLTVRFVRNGWSIKWLHREIMLSAAYQQTSLPPTVGRAQVIDPANRLLWRMNGRRLEVEAWRDAMLAVNGTLDLKVGGPPLDLGDIRNHRRTIYGTVKRRELNDLLRMHDFPDPVAHSPHRLPTTTPLQQLFVLNSPYLRQQAVALVRRLHTEVPGDNAARVRRAYELLFSRPPTPEQSRWAMDFLAGENREQAWQQYAQVLLGSNEFLYVD